jgi:hypothetical protein
MNLQTVLQTEIMESLYEDKDFNYIFNLFVCTFLTLWHRATHIWVVPHS